METDADVIPEHEVTLVCPGCGDTTMTAAFSPADGETYDNVVAEVADGDHDPGVRCPECAARVDVSHRVTPEGGRSYVVNMLAHKPWSNGPSDREGLTRLSAAVDDLEVWCPACGGESLDFRESNLDESILERDTVSFNHEEGEWMVEVERSFNCGACDSTVDVYRKDWSERGTRGKVNYEFRLPSDMFDPS